MNVPKVVSICLGSVVGGLAFCGCSAPARPTEPTQQSVTTDDFEGLWDHALYTLRSFGFDPTRQDRVNHEIVTLPLTSAQWYEFWRRDVADPFSLAESSLHTIQRRVSVHFVRSADTAPWTVRVRVDVQRMSTPERQVTTASGAIRAFGSRVPTEEGELVHKTADVVRWIDLGRDPALEHRILRDITKSADIVEG